jgi:hypothetical protein
LLGSSLPDGTELCSVNQVFKTVLQESTDLPFPVQYYDEQITCAYKMAHSKMITVQNELQQQTEQKGDQVCRMAKYAGNYMI